jgi:hypothetical protein
VLQGQPRADKNFFNHLRAGDPLDVFLGDFPSVTRPHAVAVINLASSGLILRTLPECLRIRLVCVKSDGTIERPAKRKP